MKTQLHESDPSPLYFPTYFFTIAFTVLRMLSQFACSRKWNDAFLAIQPIFDYSFWMIFSQMLIVIIFRRKSSLTMVTKSPIEGYRFDKMNFSYVMIILIQIWKTELTNRTLKRSKILIFCSNCRNPYLGFKRFQVSFAHFEVSRKVFFRWSG